MTKVSFSPSKPMTYTNVKPCVSCKHNIHNPRTPNIYHCRLFGNIDIVSGIKIYDLCSVARSDKNKCHIDGKYFEDL